MGKRKMGLALLSVAAAGMLAASLAVPTPLWAEDAQVTAAEAQAANVAKIGEMEYSTLQAAFDAAATDGSTTTVTLLADVDVSATGATIEANTNVVLDLAGNDIKAANTWSGRILVKGNLTLQDGTDADKNGEGDGRIYTETVYTDTATGYGIVSVDGGGSFTMESGLIDAASFTSDNANKGQFGVTVNNVAADATVTISGGKISAGWYAISGNGNYETNNGNIVVTGGILESTADYAIYSPQAGGVTVSGGVVSGAAGGICVNRGTLNISGGTITSRGQGSTGEWGDGTGGLGKAAVYVGARYDKVTATITGGTFTAGGDAAIVMEGSNYDSTIEVSGGTFSAPIDEKYLAPGAEFDSETGIVTTYVAQVGEKKYGTFEDALKAAVESNGTVKLIADVSLAENATISTGEIHLDLNGNTLTAGAYQFYVTGTAKLTIQDDTAKNAPAVSSDYKTVTYESGKIVYTGAYQAVSAYNGGSVTLKSGTVEALPNGSGMFAGAQNGTAGTITVEGGYVHAREYGIGVIKDGSTLNFKGGVSMADDNAAIAGNGSTGLGGTTINISGGTAIGNIVSGGYIACGVYHPQSGKLNITGGTVVANGGVTVLMRGGELTVSDGANLISTGTANGHVGDSKNDVSSGVVAVDGSAEYPGGKESGIKVAINGGTLSCDESVPVLSFGESDQVKTEISKADSVEIAAPEGYEWNEAGILVPLPKIVEVNGRSYATLDEALTAAAGLAQQGEAVSIKLLANIEGTENAGIEIAQGMNVTLDLNGFQLIGKNAASWIVNRGALTIKDGSSAGTGAIYTTNIDAQGRSAVVNYGTLTIEGGNFGDADTSRTNANAIQRGNAVRNYGTAVIKGGFFTACDNYTNGGYAYAIANGGDGTNSATLTIENATVYGNINGLIAADGGTLNVKNGSYTLGDGKASNLWRIAYTSGEGKINIEGGTFVKNAAGANRGFFGGGDGGTGAGPINVSGGVFEDKINETILIDSGTTTITNGTFKNGIEAKDEGAKLTVSGGTFAAAVDSKYAAENFGSAKFEKGGVTSYGVSDAVAMKFMGGSLRKDGNLTADGTPDYSKTNLRFGYNFVLSDGATLESWGWTWNREGSDKTIFVQGSNKRDIATEGNIATDPSWVTEGSVTNLVITKIPAANYATAITTNLSVVVTLEDGTKVTVTDEAQTRSVKEIVDRIMGDNGASDSDKEYANGLDAAMNQEA